MRVHENDRETCRLTLATKNFDLASKNVKALAKGYSGKILTFRAAWDICNLVALLGPTGPTLHSEIKGRKLCGHTLSSEDESSFK